MPSVLIVRGQLVTPWELRPWAELPESFDVSYLVTPSNNFDVSGLPLKPEPVRSLRDKFPRGRLGATAAGVIGERYLDEEADPVYARAEIVHAEELSFWFAADAARRKQKHDYKLVQTVWETLPFGREYRNRHARKYREEVLEATDLFLPVTERARQSLLLEGVDDSKIIVCPPGIDSSRFSVRAEQAPVQHTILSPGRLVWEKGHQDVMRALALLARQGTRPRLRIVGTGPEEGRLLAHAKELGIDKQVEIGSVSYEEMPAVFASASCMVLGSLPLASGQMHPFDLPHMFWEEQFGMVLAESMAAGLDILAADSGAISEVLDGNGTLFSPGDWPQIAKLLKDGPLSRPAGQRVEYPAQIVEHYSTTAMAGRLASVYDSLK